jgi:hypothetical protein
VEFGGLGQTKKLEICSLSDSGTRRDLIHLVSKIGHCKKDLSADFGFYWINNFILDNFRNRVR